MPWFDEDEQIRIEVLKHHIEFDRPCWKCSTNASAGFYDDSPDRVRGFKKGYENGELCEDCNGTRFVLTDNGEAIIQLVKRHLKETK